MTGKGEKMKKIWGTVKSIMLTVAFIMLIVVVVLLYRYNYIPHGRYPGEAFGISSYISATDADGDGLDDQSDILQSAKDYVDTKPLYKSKYYETGYPDDGYGVCTDVVAFALKGAGYDLMELVNRDILDHPEDYEIEEPDINIDFRRVANLQVYFSHTAVSLTTDPTEIDQWQGGDIVVWEHHVGIVSDVRNKKGIPFVLHNGSPVQASYEEDILEIWGPIVGHYRIKEAEGGMPNSETTVQEYDSVADNVEWPCSSSESYEVQGESAETEWHYYIYDGEGYFIDVALDRNEYCTEDLEEYLMSYIKKNQK